MPAPSLTYTLTNGSTADATQVMQNFNDLLNGYTDGTKDLSISALTCAGTATLNGAINLGNASSDDLTITASLASTLAIKTDSTYSIGSTSLRLARLWTDAISGTATNDNASAGDVGEYTSQSRLKSAADSITTATTKNVTASALTLTAGDWDLEGSVIFIPAATTTITLLIAGFSLTSATLPADDTYAVGTSGEIRIQYAQASAAPANEIVLTIPRVRISLAASDDVYLVARANFATSTMTTAGQITARRVR